MLLLENNQLHSANGNSGSSHCSAVDYFPTKINPDTEILQERPGNPVPDDSLLNSVILSLQPVVLTNHLLTQCQRRTGLYWWNGEHLEPVFKAPFSPEATLSTGTKLLAPEELQCGQEFNTDPEQSHHLSL